MTLVYHSDKHSWEISLIDKPAREISLTVGLSLSLGLKDLTRKTWTIDQWQLAKHTEKHCYTPVSFSPHFTAANLKLRGELCPKIFHFFASLSQRGSSWNVIPYTVLTLIWPNFCRLSLSTCMERFDYQCYQYLSPWRHSNFGEVDLLLSQ